MNLVASDRFWFWFGLFIVAIVTEIVLCTIAATTRHLLVCLTSLSHHNMFVEKRQLSLFKIQRFSVRALCQAKSE